MWDNRQRQLYMIHARETDYYKFGISINPYVRRDELQTGCPHYLDIVQRWIFKDCFKMEKWVHRSLKEMGFHRRGEWFKLDLRMKKVIRKHLNRIHQNNRNGIPLRE